jgi:intraflagellar transport protein 172
MAWPIERHNELIVGTAEGKVKQGVLKTNKSAPLFGSDSFVVAISSSPSGQWVCSGHLDGTILTFNLDTKAKSKIQHSTIPYALAWGSHILAGGNDGKIAFYEPTGDCFQRFDYSKDEKVKEFTCA